jgi:hypothetical protein
MTSSFDFLTRYVIDGLFKNLVFCSQRLIKSCNLAKNSAVGGENDCFEGILTHTQVSEIDIPKGTFTPQNTLLNRKVVKLD